MTKFEPRITIVARCANGHETFMFPETCVKYDFVPEFGDKASVKWEEVENRIAYYSVK